MAASPSTKPTLTFRSNNRCAFPGCPRELTADSPSGGAPAGTGVAAHNRGERSRFCYDLMLARLWPARPATPGFLIHDSTIFDGVDERQRALALDLAANESRVTPTASNTFAF